MSLRCVDPVRVAALPWLLRTLYAPKNRTALPPERLGETYTASAVRDTAWTPPASPPAVWNKAALSGIYVDENLRSVAAPRLGLRRRRPRPSVAPDPGGDGKPAVGVVSLTSAEASLDVGGYTCR